MAQFVNLPEAVLHGFLDKYFRDEEMEKEMIRERYDYLHRYCYLGNKEIEEGRIRIIITTVSMVLQLNSSCYKDAFTGI